MVPRSQVRIAIALVRGANLLLGPVPLAAAAAVAVRSSSASSVDTSPAVRRLLAQEAQLSTRLGTVQAEGAYLRAQLSGHATSVADLETALAAVRAELSKLRARGGPARG
jgi:septal ring factor EnvC (AmiA/AmiB activator)